MQQFNLTQEDNTITRADIEELLSKKPKNDNKKDHIRKSLNGKLKTADIDKIIADLDSY